MRRVFTSRLCTIGSAAALAWPGIAGADAVDAAGGMHPRAQPVAGTGVHFFSTALVHSQQATPTGLVQRSTDIIELDGDLRGRVLYHVTSTFDFVAGTLANTGNQVFSGTVLGSAPTLLHDDSFRFDVDLSTGATRGDVHLTDHIAGPKVRCHLDVVGTGFTGDGNATVAYNGTCTFRNGEGK